MNFIQSNQLRVIFLTKFGFNRQIIRTVKIFLSNHIQLLLNHQITFKNTISEKVISV